MKIRVLTVILFVLSNYTSLHAKKWPVYAKNGMVVSTQKIASEIGVEILKKGGNAVDATVAVCFALAVVHPSAGNIGGGGFMLIQFPDGKSTSIDYREKAPKAASEKMYLDENGNLIRNLNHHSYLAVGVPGTVAGLTLAQKKYGRLKLKEVLKPAIKLAEKGFKISYSLSQDFKGLARHFGKYPASEKKFLKTEHGFYEPGEVFKQKDLGKTLKRISKKGRDGFYKGKTAQFIADDMKANGGLITLEDLLDYRAVIRTPIKSTYRDYTVLGMPPPSSGGITVALMLNILEAYDLKKLGLNSAAYMHLVAEAMRRGYGARARYLGDPDFNPDIPVDKLLSKEFANELRRTISPDSASKSELENILSMTEHPETTHISVVDRDGMAVSNTYTLEFGYGSKIVAARAGFLYNNEMGDFNAVPGRTDSTGLIGTPPNLIRPEKRMLSSMTPTIILKDGKPFVVLGSPGGRRIISTVLLTILNVLDFEMNIYDAVDSPRFYHQWFPDFIKIEENGFSKDTIEILERMGHRVGYRRTQGRVMAILVDPETGYKIGAADARSPNRAAVGY